MVAMASSTGYPLHRPELFEALSQGDRLLLKAMAEHRVFGAHDVIVPAGEAHEWVYRLRTGWLCRSRTRSDGGRQIIAVLLPGDFFGIKSMLLRRQPDAVECLTDAAVNLVSQVRLREVVAAHPEVALRLM